MENRFDAEQGFQERDDVVDKLNVYLIQNETFRERHWEGRQRTFDERLTKGKWRHLNNPHREKTSNQQFLPAEFTVPLFFLEYKFKEWLIDECFSTVLLQFNVFVFELNFITFILIFTVCKHCRAKSLHFAHLYLLCTRNMFDILFLPSTPFSTFK